MTRGYYWRLDDKSKYFDTYHPHKNPKSTTRLLVTMLWSKIKSSVEQVLFVLNVTTPLHSLMKEMSSKSFHLKIFVFTSWFPEECICQPAQWTHFHRTLEVVTHWWSNWCWHSRTDPLDIYIWAQNLSMTKYFPDTTDNSALHCHPPVKANTTTANPAAALTKDNQKKILRWNQPNCPIYSNTSS